MRIVIAGRDEVSFRLAQELAGRHEVVLLRADEGRVPDQLDVQVVYGPLTATSALRKAGVEDADVFIASSRQDERNLVACVAARRLGAKKTICFLFRRENASALDDDVDVAESLGIDKVVRPARQLGRDIVRVVSVPGALDVQLFAGGRVRLLAHLVEEGAPISRGTLREIHLPDGVVLVGGRRGGEMFLPTGATRFEPGDRVTAMGHRKGIARFMRKFLWGTDHVRERHSATIVGGGSVGAHVARGLAAAGWTVRLIEADRTRAERIAPLIKALVIHGDGTDLELLEQEQVADDSVLVAVTSNDEKNLLVSLIAKSLGVPRIVTRADTLTNERLFERVGIDVVRSGRGAAIDAVLRSFDKDRSQMLAELEHGDAEVLELELPLGVKPRRLSQIHQPVFAIVGAIVRAGRVIIPEGSDELRSGDHILVFCTRADEERVRTFFLEGLLEEEPVIDDIVDDGGDDDDDEPDPLGAFDS